MFSSLYLKLIASGIVLALVAGAYFYVHSLQVQNRQLYSDNAALKVSVKQLNETITEEKKTQEVINKVNEVGNVVKEENKRVHREELKKIDDGVKAGKDRPVGPLLKEFLNG
jgi:hypothetical protein